MKEGKNFAIIHFQPLERFPPVMNMISWLEKYTEEDLVVFSNSDVSHSELATFKSSKKVDVIRNSRLGTKGLIRLWNYSVFYITTLYTLLRMRPKIVLYYESISAWPALMYKKIRGNKISLSVHYHEYSSEDIYRKSMKLVRWSHRLEKKMYAQNFVLMSHTNDERLARFRQDNQITLMPDDKFYILPNYPSQTWKSRAKLISQHHSIVKIVYVGSIGFSNTYIKEIVDWVKIHHEVFTLDIYAYNLDADAREYLRNISDSNIRFNGSVDYQDLPSILPQYDVGIVIYKPFSPSTVMGVSNKVFEYLACGLDVWFPIEIVHSHRYLTHDQYPKVIMVDFSNMDSFDYESALRRDGLKQEVSEFHYESIYDGYYKRLSQ